MGREGVEKKRGVEVEGDGGRERKREKRRWTEREKAMEREGEKG